MLTMTAVAKYSAAHRECMKVSTSTIRSLSHVLILISDIDSNLLYMGDFRDFK
jgi:hypothetical protein